MPTGKITSTLVIGGVQIYSSVSRSEEGIIVQDPSLPAAQAGTLTTWTDVDTGEITLSEGHDIVTGKVDVYWSAGRRYGMDAVVAELACAIDGGAGDNLPDQGTAVTVANQVEINIDFEGDDLAMLVIGSNKRGHADIQDSLDASLLAIDLPANEAFSWVKQAGFANPLAGLVVDKIMASNGETAASALKIGVLYSSVD